MDTIITESLSDCRLVELTLAGNTYCYEVLFHRYRGQVYAAIFHKCCDELEAGDILQETFIKAYFNLARFNPDYSFGQWVHTIARNLFIDFTRRRKKNSGTTVPIDQKVNPACDSLNPEESIISRQRSRQIDKLMGELPEHYRTMIELRFVKEYSYEEIAEKLEMPIGTVKTRIHRAREKFCTLIRDRKIL